MAYGLANYDDLILLMMPIDYDDNEVQRIADAHGCMVRADGEGRNEIYRSNLLTLLRAGKTIRAGFAASQAPTLCVCVAWQVLRVSLLVHPCMGLLF